MKELSTGVHLAAHGAVCHLLGEFLSLLQSFAIKNRAVMRAVNRDDLPRSIRFYQGIMDCRALKLGKGYR